MRVRGSRVGSAALGVVLVFLVAACGAAGERSAAGDSHGLREPLTVQHRFGTTEIDAVPKRIVTIDLQWTDVMLSLGVRPVGYTVDSRMPKSGVPWQDIPPGAEALSAADGLPLERIAALKPDLIVGTYSIGDEQTYRMLSGIAPTIAPLKAGKVTPWRDLVNLAGKMLNKQSAAADVISGVDREMSATAKALPGLKGKTFALAQYIVGDQIYVVADEQDGSSVFFKRLGMAMYPPTKRMGRESGNARVGVSTERADLLRADFLAFLINGGDRSDLADIPGFAQLPGTVAVLDYATIVGLNTPTPLSVPYVLDTLRPHLEQAAAKAT